MQDRLTAAWNGDTTIRPRSNASLFTGILIGVVGSLLVAPVSATYLPEVPALLFLPVVAAAAWFGRLLATLTAMIVSALALTLLLTSPDGSALSRLTPIVAFLLLEGAIGVVVSSERVARERARLAERRLRFLGDVMLEVESAPNPDMAVRALADYTVPELGAWCAVHLRRADGWIEPVAVAHEDPEKVAFARELQRRWPVDPEAPSGVALVLRTGQEQFVPVIDDQVLEAAAVDEEQLAIVKQLDLHSAIIVPLTQQGETFGALTLVAEGTRTYDEADLELARELARRVSTSLGWIEATRAARTARDRAERLQRVMVGVSRVADTEGVLDAVLDELRQELRAAAVLVALVDDTGEHLEVAGQTGYEEARILPWRRTRVDAHLPLSEAVASRSIVVMRNVEERVARYPAIPREVAPEDRTLICAPLLTGDELIGGVSIALEGVRSVSSDELAFLDAVTRQAAAALRRARLFDERTRIAEALQRGLQPRELPELDGVRLAAAYRPGAAGMDIGGDFYDVLATDEGAFVVIGDVCGTGVEAASLMAVTRYCAWGAAMRGASPGEVLATVDRVLAQHARDGRFVTMIAMTISSDEDGIRFAVANAGHPPPVLVGERFESIDLHGPMLGAVAGATFPEHHGVIPIGGAMILYTDGVVERTGRHVPLAHDPRLRDILTSADRSDPRSLVDAIEDVVAAAPARVDDSAVLVLSAVPALQVIGPQLTQV